MVGRQERGLLQRGRERSWCGRCASGRFGPKHVNVAAQRRDDDSLLNFLERLIRRRKETPEFGWGASTLIETTAGQLFAHRCDWQGSTGRGGAQPVRDEGASHARPRHHRRASGWRSTTCSSSASTRRNADGTLDVELDGYGYLWLRVRRAGERPLT